MNILHFSGSHLDLPGSGSTTESKAPFACHKICLLENFDGERSGGERMPMRTKNLASEEKSPGYATPKSRLVPGIQSNTCENDSGKFPGSANILPKPKSDSVALSRQSARLSLQSSQLGPPSPAGECVLLPFGSRGGTHSLAGEGVGGPNSDEGTDTVVL
jgi:hypothetical protein